MKRPLVVAAGAFFCFGGFWGSWAVATTNVEKYTGLSDAGIGLLLSASIGVGGIAAAFAGPRLAKSGPDRFLASLLLPWGALSVLASLVPGKVAFVATFALTVASAGVVDMAMNAAATIELGGSPGGLMRFHALFNVGTLCGAATVAGFVSSAISWRWTWLVTGSLALMISAAARWWAQPDERLDALPIATEDSGSLLRSFAAVREHRLVASMMAFAATAVVEGGIDTWGVLYLRTRLAVGVLVGAGAYAAGQLIAATTRASGAGLMNRLGHTRGFVLGAGLASAGLIIEASFKAPVVAACALALAAGGVSLCWPLTMARLAAPGGETGTVETTTLLVGGFTAAGYMGWVLGPAVVGALSDHAGLRAGLLLLGGVAAAAGATLIGTRQRSAAR